MLSVECECEFSNMRSFRDATLKNIPGHTVFTTCTQLKTSMYLFQKYKCLKIPFKVLLSFQCLQGSVKHVI